MRNTPAPKMYAFVPAGSKGTRFRLISVDYEGRSERVCSVDFILVPSEQKRKMAEVLAALNLAYDQWRGPE